MTPLASIFTNYRTTSQSEREKGSYFEELIRTCFRYEATYADLYSDVCSNVGGREIAHQ